MIISISNMHATYEAEAAESAISIRRIFVAIELSKSTWVVAIRPPAADKVSLFRIPEVTLKLGPW
jgi:hypothetical protein